MFGCTAVASLVRREFTLRKVCVELTKHRHRHLSHYTVGSMACDVRRWSNGAPISVRQPHRFFTSDIENRNNAKRPSNTQTPLLPSLMPVPFYHVFSGVPLYKPFSGFACKHVIGEIEKDFDLNEFSRGAKQGLLLVSEHLANQQFDKLETMVSPFAMDALRHSVERMTDDQRRQIAIGRDDFIKVLPYQVNQNFYQNNVPYLEITMVFLVIKGGHEKLRQFDVPLLLKFAENAKLCYCTFITELVDIYDSDSGDDSDDSSELSDAHVEFDWVINYFNQVKLIDPIDAVRHVLK